MKNDKQLSIFGDDNFDKKWWEKEWQDMPEFIQKDGSPHKELTIKFRNREDMREFMDIINQEFTIKTKSIWYPKLEIKSVANIRYLDET